jgi:hypothetical protein
MTKSLDAEIAAAEASGDWRKFDELSARKLTELSRRTNPATGEVRPPDPDPSGQ